MKLLGFFVLSFLFFSLLFCVFFYRKLPVPELLLIVVIIDFFDNICCLHVPLIQTLKARDLAPEAFCLINSLIKVHSMQMN